MSIAARIREMYNNGKITDSPEDKKRVAAMFGITVQTVHATLKNHLNKKESIPEAPIQVSNIKINNYHEVQELIYNKFDECYEIAKSKGIDLPKIEVHFDLKGVVAGQFCRYDRMFFRVNLVLAEENINDYLNQTVPHEFSHYIVRSQFNEKGFEVKSHGYEWKRTMVRVFGLNPERCQYDTTNAKVRQTQTYTYKCGCRQIQLGALRHKRMQLKERSYICCYCHKKLEYVGN
jgi:SprT protein